MTHVTETAATVNHPYLAGAPPSNSMDTTTALLPSTNIKTQTPTPPESESNLTKQKQHSDTTNTLTGDLPPPPFINSVNELRNLSTALSTFLKRYDELNDHLNFIKTSIDSKLPNHLLYSDNPNPNECVKTETSLVDNVTAKLPNHLIYSDNPNPNECVKTETSFVDTVTVVPDTISTEGNPNCGLNHENVSKREGSSDMLEKFEETDIETDTLKNRDVSELELEGCCEGMRGRGLRRRVIRDKTSIVDTITAVPETMSIDQNPNCTRSKFESSSDMSEKFEETDMSKNRDVSELEGYCERMSGRGLRRYVVGHISDIDKLREEIPKALKLAKGPAKLVLEGIGRFFSTGTSAFPEGSKASVARLAAVLILECFVMISSDGIEIGKEEEEYAEKAAADWRKRMIKEGGLPKTDEVDARGLLLLISGFGIPDVFKIEDIRDLIRVSNVKKFSSALCRSAILIRKIPEVIDWMVKNNMETEAADIAYTFGLKDRCHPLTTFLHNKVTDSQHDSFAQVDKGANSGVSFNKTDENVRKPESPDSSENPEETENSNKTPVSELESCAEQMCGRALRAYVVSHISDTNKLHKEIPKALKLAKNPAKFVLEGVGRFFLQGSRSFTEGSKVSVVRLASVMILECFVMISSDGIEIDKEEEEYAEKAAVDWRKRMIKEGGLAKTDEVDARGLLLLISGFGIPDVFKIEDIRDLIRVSNGKKISSALRRSIILIPKIPEVIDWMVKNDMEIEAADTAYTFGLEDKCRPQTILTKFLHNNINDSQHGSSAQYVKKQLSVLKSIKRCLEAHNVDPSKPLADYKINERILQLEKEINKPDSNPPQKRKVKETESSRNQKQHNTKRTRLSSHRNPPQEPKPFAKSPYNPLTRPVESGGGLAGGGMLTGSYSSGLAVESDGGLTGPYGSGRFEGAYLDQMVNGQPYGSLYLGQPYSGLGQTYGSQPSTSGLIGLYGRQLGRPSLEGFPGLPGSSVSTGYSGSGSDLYGFADTVVQNESNRGSYASSGGTMRLPHLY